MAKNKKRFHVGKDLDPVTNVTSFYAQDRVLGIDSILYPSKREAKAWIDGLKTGLQSVGYEVSDIEKVVEALLSDIRVLKIED